MTRRASKTAPPPVPVALDELDVAELDAEELDELEMPFEIVLDAVPLTLPEPDSSPRLAHGSGVHAVHPIVERAPSEEDRTVLTLLAELALASTFLRRLDSGTLARMAADGALVNVPGNERVREHMPDDGVAFVVLSGHIALKMPGSSETFGIAGNGAMLGDLEHAEAGENAMVLALDADLLAQVRSAAAAQPRRPRARTGYNPRP